MIKIFRLFSALMLMGVLLDASTVDAALEVQHLRVVLIVDNSGSMKANDPGGLRFTGMRLLLSLLDPGDSFGLILFSTESERLTSDFVTLNSQQTGIAALEDFQPPQADGFTNIKAALEDANKMFHRNNGPEAKAVIVVLTDGKPEIPDVYPEYEKDTLELARALKIPIQAIALTPDGQTPFLEHLADASGGSVFSAKNSSDLLNVYLQVFGAVKDRTVIGGDTFKAQGSLLLEPALAPYITAMTFVFAKPEYATVSFLGQDGQNIGSDLSHDPRFSIFTVDNPAGGNYVFQLQGGGEAQGWAILRSRLRLQILSPHAIYPLQRDMPIVVNLLEETPGGEYIKIIGDANFTALITAPKGHITSLDRFYDDGTHGDVVSDDGNYTRLLSSPDLDGGYDIFVQGWKGFIPVQAETQVKVEKFPELVVDSPADRIEIQGGAINLQARLDMATFFEQGEIVAKITSPSGQVNEIIIQGKGVYNGEYLPVEDGRYRIVFETRDVKYHGVEYQTSIERTFDVTIIPFVNVSVSKAETPVACLSSPNEVLLSLSLLSSGNETLRFSVPDGWNVLPESVKVEKGRQDIQLQLRAIEGLSKKTNRVEMKIEGGKGLEVRPAPVMSVDFEVPGLYVRCQTPIHLGVFLLFVAVVGVTSIRHARRIVLPPHANGTLRHWKIGDDVASAMEIDLTEFGKQALTIGSGATCDVMIPDAGLEPEQARLFAEKSANGTDIYLGPMGEVRKGYSMQHVRFVLRHGDTFRMGTHEFQYLSDHGE